MTPAETDTHQPLRSTVTHATEHAKVSVVVCTRNRAELLREAIKSLGELNVNDNDWVEVLVVDNGSSDHTRDAVREAAADSTRIPVRYVLEPVVGVRHARNRGIREARGDWIAFFDDDQKADREWMSELLKTALSHRVLCVGGQVRLVQLDGSRRNLGPLCRDLLSEQIAPDQRKYDLRFKPCSGNMLVHRLALDAVGGFSSALGNRGEDTILYLNLYRFGYEGWYNPKSVVYHCIPAERLTDEAFERLTENVGKYMPYFEKDYWRAAFPLAWAARLAQALLALGPRALLASFTADADRRLETRLQFKMACLRVWHGAKFLFSSSDVLKKRN